MPTSAKLVVSVLVITAVSAVGLWLVGGKKQEYSAAIEIDASPDVVFNYLTDPEKQKSWIKGLSEVARHQSNTDEDGASRRITTTRVISVDGQETRFEDQVLRFDLDRSLTVRSSNSDQIVTAIFQLEPRDEQTSMMYRLNRVSCGINRFLAPLSNDTTQSRIDDEIRKLKQLVESGH